MSRIVIVSGPPGAGKSTVAQRLSQQVAGPLGMHMHTDDIYTYVTKGFIEPWKPESMAQNITLMAAMAAQAAVCAGRGYEVYVDGLIGPWFLDPWREAAGAHAVDLRYLVLRPDLATTLARATARTAPNAMTDPAVVEQMWRAFQGDAVVPDHVVDTTRHTMLETIRGVAEDLEAGRFRLT